MRRRHNLLKRLMRFGALGSVVQQTNKEWILLEEILLKVWRNHSIQPLFLLHEILLQDIFQRCLPVSPFAATTNDFRVCKRIKQNSSDLNCRSLTSTLSYQWGSLYILYYWLLLSRCVDSYWMNFCSVTSITLYQKYSLLLITIESLSR